MDPSLSYKLEVVQDTRTSNMGVLDQLLSDLRQSLTLVVVIAAVFSLPLLRVFAPQDRRRRIFLVAVVLSHLALIPTASLLGEGVARSTLRLLSSICAGVAIVLMAGGILFTVVLPKLHVRPPRIVQDLMNAAAAVIVTFGLASGHGVDLSSLIATSAVLTAVIGFALQDTLGNLFSGLALQLDDSIRAGDWIRVGEYTGKVTNLRWRYVSIETRNWETLVIPNSILTKAHVLVLGKRSGEPTQLRRWVYFNVDFRFQPTEVIDAVIDSLCSAPIHGVASDPKPNCILMDLAESYCRYAVRYWLTDLALDDPTDSIVRTRIYVALKRVDIPLSMPAHAVFMTKESERRKERKSMKEEDDIAHTLARVPLFAHLAEEELSRLAKHTRDAPFARGETMTRQGAQAHWLYVIIEGEASVHVKMSDGRSKEVSRLGPLDFFGEMGLMTGAPRAATVIAETDVECFRLDSEGFAEILKDRPAIADQIAEILSRRRTELVNAISDLQTSPGRHDAKGDLLDKIRSFFGLGD
jgi:small-conductance mechanosensitive channel/CRP-like cAMP-binding protein